MDIEQKLKEQIKENPVLIYMKGTPYEPRCGFSARTVQILIECDSEFSYVDILENNDVRTTLPKVSDWPTFPQVFIKGELIGGADIIAQMHESGELKKLAMLGDLHIAEPGALIAFAGARVIQGTVKEELSEGFQKSEYVEKTGFVDLIIERKDLTDKIGTLLSILLKKNSVINSEQNETSENSQSLTKAAS